MTRGGGLDAMVHNATSRRSSDPARLEVVDDELWDDHASVSLRGAYHCARAALPSLGVRVNGVSPLAETPAMTSAYEQDPELEARITGRVPLGRLGDPEAGIGPAVVFLASGDARYITGQTLVVDGGRFMTL